MSNLSEPELKYDILQKFLPLTHLPHESLRELSGRSRLFTVTSGTTLFSIGDTDDWTLFLLKGQVNLTFDDDARESISSASEASRMPLAPLTPRPATARAAGPASIIRVPRSLLEIHLGHSNGSGIEVVETSEDSAVLEDRLLEKMVFDYFNQQVEVPVLPDVALRVRELANDPEAAPKMMADIVGGDPSLSAKLVQVANSPVCRGTVEITGCRDAITRLGMKAASEIVLSMAMANVFESESPILKARMQALWRSSARVGALCCVLARETKIVPPDRAMLAGLVHDIGAIAVVAGANDYSELIGTPGALDRAVEALRGQFGSMILRSWKFTDDIVACAIEMDAWDRTPVHPDCCGLVQVARVLNTVGTGQFARMPKLTTLPAFRRLKLGWLSSENVFTFLKEADETIAELEHALNPSL